MKFQLSIEPKKDKTLLNNRYQLIRTLGQGNYGQVYLVKDIMSNQKLALKKIARNYDLKRDKSIEREIQICLLLNHPNIVHIKTYFKDEEYYYLIFEHIEGNSLATLLKKKKLKSKQINLYLFQLLDAITYCHYHSVVHRDLKIENIMITNTSQLKVIDFGLSNYFNITQKLTTYCGTIPYISPEIVKANCYVGPEVDIWSIGVILYAMCTRTLPFGNPNIEKNYYAIVTGQVNYSKKIKIEYKQIMQQCFIPKGELRISSIELLNKYYKSKIFNQPKYYYFLDNNINFNKLNSFNNNNNIKEDKEINYQHIELKLNNSKKFHNRLINLFK